MDNSVGVPLAESEDEEDNYEYPTVPTTKVVKGGRIIDLSAQGDGKVQQQVNQKPRKLPLPTVGPLKKGVQVDSPNNIPMVRGSGSLVVLS